MGGERAAGGYEATPRLVLGQRSEEERPGALFSKEAGS